MKYFLKKLLGHELFTSMVSWATKYFLKNLENPPDSPRTILMYCPKLDVKDLSDNRKFWKTIKLFLVTKG